MTVDESLKTKVKQLKIQTGVVQRLNKEIRYYMKEEASLLARFEKLKAEDSEEANQAGECYADCKKVAPQVTLQLITAHKELYVLLESEFADFDPSISPDDSVSKEVLQARSQLIKTAEVIPDIEQRAAKHFQTITEDSKQDEELLTY